MHTFPFALHARVSGREGGVRQGAVLLFGRWEEEGREGVGLVKQASYVARALGASMGVEVALPLCEYRGEECHPRTFDIRRVAVSAMCGSFVRLVSRDSSY